jgi:hypothetical protein
MLICSLDARSAVLDGFKSFMENGSGTALLRVQQNLVTLVDFELAATPFGSAVQDALVLASTPISGTASASGRATRALLINQNGDVGITVDVGPTDWFGLRAPRLQVTDGATQSLGALVVRMSPSGSLYLEGSLALQ